MGKVKLELSKKNTSEKVDFARKVVTSMTGNANFPTPNPALADISTAATNVTSASDDVENTRKLLQTKIVYLAQQETILDSLLTQLGTYVENISSGDEVKINSAGMDVKRERSSSGLPGKITGINATVGDNAGEIGLYWDKDDAAKSYVVEIAPEASPMVWQSGLVSTKTRATVKNLTSATRYYIHVAAVGAAGQGPWSDTVNKVVP
jgi:hypothetical protein